MPKNIQTDEEKRVAAEQKAAEQAAKQQADEAEAAQQSAAQAAADAAAAEKQAAEAKAAADEAERLAAEERAEAEAAAAAAAAARRPAPKTTAVTYIGKRYWTDRLYGSGLDFEPGQTREMPTELARKFLKHADMFAAASVTPAQERKQQEVDDTQAKLDAAAQKRAMKKAEQDRRQDLVDRVNAMDEQSLRDFAKNTYQQEIDGRVHDVAKLREKVIGFVDQFGFE